MKSRFHTPLSTVALVASCLALGHALWSCQEPNDGDLPPLESACGLEGQRVWCNTDMDCPAEKCASNGVCYLPGALTTICSDSWHPYCVGLPDYFCVSDICRRPCRSHTDCEPGGQCLCQEGLHFCSYMRCEDGLYMEGELGCPEGTSPIEGSLICQIDNLEGTCHNGWECDPGYERVGERGCLPLYDCGNGVQEAGEDCDGTDLGGATCESLGKELGSGPGLTCNPDCGFYVLGCF